MARPVPSLGPIARKPRSLTAFAVSILGHSLVFGGVVVYAFGAPGAFPEPAGVVVLAPLPEIPAPPPPPAAQPPGVRGTTLVKPPQPADDGKLVAPSEDPTTIPQPEAPDFASVGGCTQNCVDGGLVGGVGIGDGIVGGLEKTVHQEAQPPRAQRISEVHGPRKVRSVAPVYPLAAIAARIEGRVVLDCLITQEGRIAEVTVLEGNALLVPAAEEAVKQWLYTPTLLNGVPSPVLMKVTVNFALRR